APILAASPHWLQFSQTLAPAAIIGLAINFIILRFGFRRALRAATIEPEIHVVPKLDRGLFAIVCIVFVSIFACFVAGLNLAWTALSGAVLVMVLARRDTHEVLNWSIGTYLYFSLRCLSSSMG